MFGGSEAFSGFAVDDVATAESFYREVLGLAVERQGEMFTLRLGGGTEVLVYPKPDHRPATFTILNFPVADIDRAVEELVGRGVSLIRYDHFAHDERGVVRPPQDDGPLIAWFADPAGNILAVLQDQ
jgi:predicted enzyme related to lactoylglutathione lyase